VKPTDRGGRSIGWLMVLVWATWLEALSGWMGARPALAAWAPDLGLLLFLAIAARLGAKLMAKKRETVGTFGLVVAMSAAEASVSSLGLAPILAGWLGVLFFQGFWRRGLDVERPLLRLLIAGGATLGLLIWHHIVLGLDLAEETRKLTATVFSFDAGAWRSVLLTAALAPVLMPIALALPGVGLYWRGR